MSLKNSNLEQLKKRERSSSLGQLTLFAVVVLLIAGGWGHYYRPLEYLLQSPETPQLLNESTFNTEESAANQDLGWVKLETEDVKWIGSYYAGMREFTRLPPESPFSEFPRMLSRTIGMEDSELSGRVRDLYAVKIGARVLLAYKPLREGEEGFSGWLRKDKISKSVISTVSAAYPDLAAHLLPYVVDDTIGADFVLTTGEPVILNRDRIIYFVLAMAYVGLLFLGVMSTVMVTILAASIAVGRSPLAGMKGSAKRYGLNLDALVRHIDAELEDRHHHIPLRDGMCILTRTWLVIAQLFDNHTVKVEDIRAITCNEGKIPRVPEAGKDFHITIATEFKTFKFKASNPKAAIIALETLRRKGIQTEYYLSDSTVGNLIPEVEAAAEL